MGKLRSIYRLLAFACISTFYLLLLWARSWFKGRDMDYGMAIRQKWSKLCNKVLNIKIELENQPPRGAYLYLSNHRSYMDITVLLAYIRSSIVAKAEVANWPVIGAGAKQTYTVMVKREDKDSRKQTRDAVAEILSRGYSMLIYAEGTTFDGPGILPLRPGPFEVAEQGLFPIVPIAIEYKDPTDAWVGDWDFWEHFLHAFQKKEMVVRLKFGEVIPPGDAAQTRQQVQAWIDTETRQMRAQFDK